MHHQGAEASLIEPVEISASLLGGHVRWCASLTGLVWMLQRGI